MVNLVICDKLFLLLVYYDKLILIVLFCICFVFIVVVLLINEKLGNIGMSGKDVVLLLIVLEKMVVNLLFWLEEDIR